MKQRPNKGSHAGNMLTATAKQIKAMVSATASLAINARPNAQAIPSAWMMTNITTSVVRTDAARQTAL